MSTVSKTTHVFAKHEIPLECDVYSAPNFPVNGPVFLFFHSGGLVGGSRAAVPPWLIQTCVKKQWPLVSASYRLLPQAQGKELLEDAKAAYEFAESLGGSAHRPVTVGGASAGAFLATIATYHLQTKPLALLSITGIVTFRHRFFNSSILLTPEPPEDTYDLERYLAEPVSVGKNTRPDAIFHPESVLSTGAKNKNFVKPKPGPPGDPGRGMLYDYYLHENMFLPLVSDVDPGFDWTKEESGRDQLSNWPPSIFIIGDADPDVDPDVSLSAAKALGAKGTVFTAQGQPHLFQCSSFIEDEGNAMNVVRAAVQSLETAVDTASAERKI